MTWYKEELLDHYRFPRHKGKLLQPDFTSAQHNPSCGDHVWFEAKIADGTVVEIAFDGAGCVISQASASLLAVHVYGKPILFVTALTTADIIALVGIELGPTRLKCALLALHALQQGLQNYRFD